MESGKISVHKRALFKNKKKQNRKKRTKRAKVSISTNRWEKEQKKGREKAK